MLRGRSLRNRAQLLAVVLAVSCATSTGCYRPSSPMVRGLENSQLALGLRGVILMDRPVGGIEAIDLNHREHFLVRQPGDWRAGGTVHSVAGPDRSGRVVFVENHMAHEEHFLKTKTLHGSDETIVVQRSGDALWGHATGEALWGHTIGRELALAPTRGLAAFAADLSGVQMHDPEALLEYGHLEVWDIAGKQRLSLRASALDNYLSWFPDSKRLAFVDLAPATEVLADAGLRCQRPDQYGQRFERWPRVPVVRVLDIDTGRNELIQVGWSPVVSSDGRAIVARDFDNQWCLIDTETKKGMLIQVPGAIQLVALLDSTLIIYWAWPTEGTKVMYTKYYSPLVGPRTLRTLKVARVGTNDFFTLVPYVDPRRSVSFGPGPEG